MIHDSFIHACLRCAVSAVLLFAVSTVYASRPFEEAERAPGRFHLLRPAMATPAEQLDHANQLREAGRRRRAQRQYRALVRYWPSSEEAARAQLAYAQVLQDRGKWIRAFEEYQELLNRYSGLVPHRKVLDSKLLIAEELIERRRGRFLFFPGFGSPERAVPVLESIVRQGPRWERAAEAQLLIGQIKEEAGDWEEAVFAYERVETRYPGTPQALEAAFGKARTLYRLSNKYPTHLDGAETAMHALALFIQNYPDAEYADAAREYLQALRGRIEQIEFAKAEFYDRKAREPQAALLSYELFLQRFPHSDLAEKARKRMAALRDDEGIPYD